MAQQSLFERPDASGTLPPFQLAPATALSVLVSIREMTDIVNARQSGRQVSSTFKASEVEATFITTIISELARNILIHAGRGEIQIDSEQQNGRARISITARDTGPGIKDLSRALLGGYSTCGRMGLGLSGVCRLADEFNIDSSPDAGTTVVAKTWLGHG